MSVMERLKQTAHRRAAVTQQLPKPEMPQGVVLAKSPLLDLPKPAEPREQVIKITDRTVGDIVPDHPSSRMLPHLSTFNQKKRPRNEFEPATEARGYKKLKANPE